MEMNQAEHDNRRCGKAAKVKEKDLLLKARTGTKQVLLEQLVWAGIEDRARQ
ncbi:hypothetical protein [Pseudomonas asiatica]|uniref:Uncharacterized protein n=1 Tax=Pseudomonas asiatica TaxID=2219225 RepID=A0A9X4D4X3_9PSED|nr:hypothetical protein [Pseudomonas asiatica]MDD2109874.1 hypothetical protein [Pseudomonas asiatica]